MSAVAFIEAMVADGWSLADAVRAAKTYERMVEPTRTKGAQRQARYAERQRQKASEIVSNDADDARDVSPPPSLPPSPRPPTTHTLTPVETTTRARPAKRCPEGWTPTEPDRAIGLERGLSPAEIDGEFAKFRDHTFGTARSDWSATFRNWLRTASESRRRPKVTANDQPSRIDDIHARAFAASERAIAARALEREGCG